MSGTASLLLLLSCCQVFAYDDIEPPQELNITVPKIGEVVVTWKHISVPGNKSIKYVVKVSNPETLREIKTIKNTYTYRMVAGLQGGLAVHVAAEIHDLQGHVSTLQSKWVSGSLPTYPGVNGTSAVNVSCQIDLMASEKCFLSCKWDPGDKAPADTQYNLYYRYEDVIEKCQDYITEPCGQRRTGCSMVSGDISPNSAKDILIHINGTSKSLKIKAMEQIFPTSTLETIPPVQDLTVNVSGIHWRKPVNSLSEACFHYEVNIWSKDRNETITVVKSSYLKGILQKTSNRQFIRVRAIGSIICWPDNIYSQWTDIIHTGEDVNRSDSLGIIVSICLIVTCILIFFLFVRYWGHIFPHIPKPKNELKEAFQNVQSQALMRCNSWDTEEVISYIEEVVDPEKYKTPSSDYGHIEDYSSSGPCKPL